MSHEEEIRLLREILDELKALRALSKEEHPKNWETCINEHMSRIDSSLARRK